MATLVLGVAGAAVGNFLLPGIGGSLGWAIGAGLGGALFPGKGQDGPRLTDLRLQNSTYGAPIPVPYGTVRIAGQVIWQTDLQEASHSSSGKGGPKVTTFSYSASFAILLCEGPIIGVRRVWADNRLVWGGGVENPDADFQFTLYLGSETQLADPTMEADLGAGNVPAHRGTAYAVFTDLPLGAYGNRLPALTWEIMTAAGDIPWRVSTWTVPKTRSVHTELISAIARPDGDIDVVQYGPLGSAFGTGWYICDRYDIYGTYVETIDNLVVPGMNNSLVTHGWIASSNSYIGFQLQGGMGGDPNEAGWYNRGRIITQGVDGGYYGVGCPPVYLNDYVYSVGGNGGAALKRWQAPGGVPLAGTDASYAFSGTDPGYLYSITLGDDGFLYVQGPDPSNTAFTALFKFDSDLALLHTWHCPAVDSNVATQRPAEMGTDSRNQFTVWGGYVCFASHEVSGNFVYVYTLAADLTFAFVGKLTCASSTDAVSLGNGLVLLRDGVVSLVPPRQAITLASIVADLSDRAGLTGSQYDVTELTDLVDGYTVSGLMAIRSAIEPLQAAYFFDGVEHDDLVWFRKRGVTPSAVIEDDDLDGRSYGEDPGTLFATQRLQEVDLPNLATVQYLNVDADYQVSEQYARRQVTSSEQAANINLPIVMDDAKAKSIADTLLFDAWLGRNRFSFATGRKWAKLEPTDVIEVHGRVLRITQKDESFAGIVKFEGLETRSDVYTQYAPPVPAGGFVPPALPVTQTTDVLLMDLPLLDGADSPYTIYTVMAGNSDPATWPGAVVFKSTDGGTNYNSVISSNAVNSFGQSTAALANFTGGNIFDETNTVEVVLTRGSGELASATELSVLNGANGARLGSEIIQYKTATLTAARTYTLSGLLRGRLGTEWAMTTHAASDIFAVLDASTIRMPVPQAELNLARQYKAVTTNMTLASATQTNFTFTGVTLKPYAPVHLGGGRDASANLTLQWQRRTRIGGAWLDNVDVPMLEGSEWYAVTICADSGYSTVKRYILSQTTTASYTAAEQTTDFGSTQATIYWIVQQWGLIGYGYAARGVT